MTKAVVRKVTTTLAKRIALGLGILKAGSSTVLSIIIFVATPVNGDDQVSVKDHEKFVQQQPEQFELGRLSQQLEKEGYLNEGDKQRYIELMAKLKGVYLYAKDVQSQKVWVSIKDNNFTGALAKRLGSKVLDVDKDFEHNGQTGDIDMVTEEYNIEVKSGKRMKLTQSEKNKSYTETQDKKYFIFMPQATSVQIRDAKKKGIEVITSESKLKEKIKK